jgi:FAD synthetase
MAFIGGKVFGIPSIISAVAEVVSTGSSSQELADRVKKSVDCIQDTIRIFGAQSVAIAFNGGKDACVLLYLLVVAVDTLQVQDALGKDIKIVYFEDDAEFPEMKSFLEYTRRTLNIDCYSVKSTCKDGMVDLVASGLRAILLGTRRGDPHTDGAEHFIPSTQDYPPFMRVNPILEWRYDEVWEFLRHCQLPYCSLYDEGYTSLGNSTNSVKNPSLRLEDGSYRPAYTLEDTSLERKSRTVAPI